MKTKNILLSTLMSAVFFMASQSAIAAPVTSFTKVESQQTFTETTAAIQTATSRHQMMVMGKIDQGKVLSMTGLDLKGTSFLIGNPEMAKKVFSMNPAAGAVLPLRLYVWNQNNKTWIGWFNPAEQLGMISPKLVMPGQMLEKKIMNIATQAATK
ncbi:DUF302 domain-containing protein [Photobacterium phosphoreum]|jgi:uncharacterized protein (DUF302 family)|uniref:DUF302 domain-containing protein n=1 Tax=Photobacterium phosphoreum TaxID=659 RepID=A0AAW5A121_PHOPO|nr:DUF302 domain-containing protein [Photobacterium phosphoreum]KJF87791.1 hypothetical protein UB41_04880 [Photobacterium phosphoreum]MCD9464499.1 DUF302 domain-containing protein [Photobacterium phosphoreum]MCD9471918.1 DUF302 domain-containing protein [Photobacterium phosphoreum]MCD9475479.1 DUF302 domain-containing protein [Photobacterium phosphoreum]MCD9480049.1 DUF302 domain-containing protein [Photobacterium phosphoreum]